MQRTTALLLQRDVKGEKEKDRERNDSLRNSREIEIKKNDSRFKSVFISFFFLFFKNPTEEENDVWGLPTLLQPATIRGMYMFTWITKVEIFYVDNLIEIYKLKGAL